METIDLTPKWSAIMPYLIEVLKDPNAKDTAKAEIGEELIRLAKFADEIQAEQAD